MRLRTVRDRLSAAPYGAGGHRQLFHVSHHKAGTVWLGRVLESVASEYGLSYGLGNAPSPTHREDVLLFWNAFYVFDEDDRRRGSHMVRDPRDMVVSGYRYHLWSDEAWLHEPAGAVLGRSSPELEGLSFQQYLNSLDKENGLAVEIEWFAKRVAPEMRNWDYSRPDILELRYEDVLANEAAEFERLFRHYGFTERAVRRSVDLALEQSLSRTVKREGSHVRSGVPGQWQGEFSAENVAFLAELTGDLPAYLSYRATDEG